MSMLHMDFISKIQYHNPIDIIGLEHVICPDPCLGKMLEGLIAVLIDVGYMPCNVIGK